jgi:hypothetical protein
MTPATPSYSQPISPEDNDRVWYLRRGFSEPSLVEVLLRMMKGRLRWEDIERRVGEEAR